MENFDSLFSNQQQCSEQPFDKKQWAQQKQEKRQDAREHAQRTRHGNLLNRALKGGYGGGAKCPGQRVFGLEGCGGPRF